MTPEQRASWAQQALQNPVIWEVMDDLEASAINGVCYANADAHDVRLYKAAEIRAVRLIRDALKAIAEPIHTVRKTVA